MLRALWYETTGHIILLLQKTTVSDAAYLMLQRYPPLCKTNDPASGPVFVQLMVVDAYQPDHHGGLINVEVDDDGQVNITLHHVPEEPECSESPNPSVAPGTMFFVTYPDDNCVNIA